MRGLSAEERRLLSSPRPYYNSDEEIPVIEALIAQGRCRELPSPVPEDQGEEWGNTDLGNLALRVCLAEELV